MTLHCSTQPSGDIDQLRRNSALAIGIGAAACIMLSVGLMALALTRIRSSDSYVYGIMLGNAITASIGPILLMIFAPSIARGRGGAAAAALVISLLIAAQWLFSTAWFTLEFGARGLNWDILWSLPRGAIAIVINIFAVRLWWQERSLEPDAPRVQGARSAWFRARVALVISWALLAILAALTTVLGTVFYLDSPQGMGGGIGIIFIIFGGVVAAFFVWLLILWIVLRRRGPRVARATAWQVASMLILWTLVSSLGGGAGMSSSLMTIFPSAMLAWILIELLHATLARNSGQLIGAFEVIPMPPAIPIAQPVPPPLPRSMFEPMEGREHV